MVEPEFKQTSLVVPSVFHGGKARSVEYARIRTIALVDTWLFEGLIVGVERGFPLVIRRSGLEGREAIERVRDELVHRLRFQSCDSRRVDEVLERGRVLRGFFRLPRFLLGAAGLALLLYYWNGPMVSTLVVDESMLFGSAVPGLIFAGEIDRLVTANFLHFDLRHCASNIRSLFLFGWLAEVALGPRLLFLVGVPSGVLAYAFSVTLIQLVEPFGTSTTFTLVGGSAVVSAIVGSSFCLLARRYRVIAGARWFAVTYCSAFLVKFLLYEHVGAMAEVTHAAGFVSGFLATWCFIGPASSLPLEAPRRCGVAALLVGVTVVACIAVSVSRRGGDAAQSFVSLACAPVRSESVTIREVNACSWAVAASVYSSDRDLLDAFSVMRFFTALQPRSLYRDTLAWLHYRIGDWRSSLEMRQNLWARARDPYNASHLARLYSTASRASGSSGDGFLAAGPVTVRRSGTGRRLSFAIERPSRWPGVNLVHALVYERGEIFGFLEVPSTAASCDVGLDVPFWQGVGDLSVETAWAGYDASFDGKAGCTFRMMHPAVARLPAARPGVAALIQQPR